MRALFVIVPLLAAAPAVANAPGAPANASGGFIAERYVENPDIGTPSLYTRVNWRQDVVRRLNALCRSNRDADKADCARAREFIMMRTAQLAAEKATGAE